MDYAMAHAIYILDAEKCKGCQLPAWHAFSTDNSIEFKMEEHVCQGCAFKETEEAKLEKKKDHKKKPGATQYVTVQHAEWEYEEEGHKSKLPGRLEWKQSQ